MGMSRSKCAWRREGQPISHALRDTFRETAAEGDSTARHLTRHAEHRESSLAGELHNSILGTEIAAMRLCAVAFTSHGTRCEAEQGYAKKKPSANYSPPSISTELIMAKSIDTSCLSGDVAAIVSFTYLSPICCILGQWADTA